MDLWGQMYRNHWDGDPGPHLVERDDGNHTEFESAGDYFKAPRSEPERELLDALAGPVLDI